MGDDRETLTPGQWSCFHFSQSNPAGPGQEDVPTLLRTVADSIEALGSVYVHDLILSQDVTADGLWPSVTVYYSLESDDGTD